MEHARDTEESVIRVLASRGSYLDVQFRAICIGWNSGVVATWVVVAECWLWISAHRLLVAFELLWHLMAIRIVEDIPLASWQQSSGRITS